MNSWLKRLAPLAVIAALAAITYALGWHRYLSLDAVRQNQAVLETFVRDNPIASAGAYIAVYAGVVALSLPGATIMSVLGGFLFGLAVGASLAVAGASIGATLVFLAARTAIGDVLRRRAGPYLRRIEAGFKNDAFNYILFLRLMPIFPFWAVNLSMAVLGVPLIPYVAATALGIIPGAIVIVAVGAGVRDFVDLENGGGLTGLFSPTLLFALAGLAILSVLPVALRKWRAARGRLRD